MPSPVQPVGLRSSRVNYAPFVDSDFADTPALVMVKQVTYRPLPSGGGFVVCGKTPSAVPYEYEFYS